MCGVPEEPTVKREEKEEREKPRQMKNIVRLYIVLLYRLYIVRKVLWAKVVKTKSKLFEQAGFVEEDGNSPAKNHKSFTVEYPL